MTERISSMFRSMGPLGWIAVVLGQLAVITMLLILISDRLDKIRIEKVASASLRRSLNITNVELSQLEQLLLELMRISPQMPEAAALVKKYAIAQAPPLVPPPLQSQAP